MAEHDVLEDSEKQLAAQEQAAAGVSYFKDSGGRLWRIRVFPIKQLETVSGLMHAVGNQDKDPETGELITDSRTRRVAWQVLFYMLLMNPLPMPGWWIRIRRLLGLPDYSLRYIGNNVSFRDKDAILANVCRANMGAEFDEILNSVSDPAKKKSPSSG